VQEAYKGKKVFVTGHTGFKGSWLVSWLLSSGADVVGYSLEPPTEPSFFDACGLERRIRSLIGDVRDFDNLYRAISKEMPEFVFHLAAQTLVRLSYSMPRETFETNIMGTVNVLEAVRRCGSVRALVNVTSDKCYENFEWFWGYRENDKMGGHDCYSASKGCSELVTNAFRNSFFSDNDSHVRVASVRAGNVIGGGDWAEDRLLPDCVRALRAGRSIMVRNPRSIRPWQYVLEPLSGYLLLGQKLAESGDDCYCTGWNFGPELSDTIPVEEVVNEVIRAWGGGHWRCPNNREPAEHEATFLRLDCSKAFHILGWRPVYDIHTAISRTVDWYKKFHDGGVDMFEFSLHEIALYCDSAAEKGLLWAI
jgi:CDP-glucose 4,6-dehydratase